MTTVAYYNGKIVPHDTVSVPIYDAGFVLGTTITEQLRTFGQKLFRLDQHLARLKTSLELVGIDLPLNMAEMGQVAQEVVAHNAALLDNAEEDLGLAVWITPGPYPTMAPPDVSGPAICLHTYQLPFSLWADKYEKGLALAVPEIRQVSARCWPRELKCRSRMHYYLADRQANEIDPGARALLLDEDDFVTEATTASLVIYRQDEGLISPCKQRVLPGISVAAVEELAVTMGVPFQNRDLTIDDVATADEALLASTTSCALPVVRFNKQPIGTGKPGEVYRGLMSNWNKLVGIDIIAQACKAT